MSKKPEKLEDIANKNYFVKKNYLLQSSLARVNKNLL